MYVKQIDSFTIFEGTYRLYGLWYR